MQDLSTEVQKQRKDAAGKGHQPPWGIVSANLVQEHQPTWGIVSAAQERRPPRGIDTPARLGLVVAWLCNWWWRVVCGWLRLRVKFA